MRSTIVVGVLAALAAGAAPAPAQSYPAQATIIVPRAEARSGPSEKFYTTAELRQGEVVSVVRPCKDQPGWLAIMPPPGSFSWVKAKAVKQLNSQVAVVPVDAEAVPVMVAPSVPALTVALKAPSAVTVPVSV